MLFFSLVIRLYLLLGPLTLVSVCSPFAYEGLSRNVQQYDKFHQSRTSAPYFPDSPASCPICAANYSSIQSCAEAAPVLANFSMIIFNPGAFIDVIQCACTETFQSVFPQCVDCFVQTNQTDVLSAPDLPSVVQGMRNVCAVESTLLGGAASADGEVPSSTSAASASASTSSNAASALFTTVNVRRMAPILAMAGLIMVW